MPLSPKTRLGTYEIVGPLGAGGMGEVYRARDLRLGREVAVKVLPQAVASSPDRLARFEREARTVAGLNHPNIVTLHSVEDEDGIRFLTMELVEGATLSDHIAPGGMPLARLLEVSIPLTDALVAAHERGVVHRDLKPGNVMVTCEGRVKVLDFGLARMASDEAAPLEETLAATADTPAGQMLGTVPYMSPEQVRGETIDARSDLFAIGIILYELATGRRPFAGQSSADLISSILRDTPEPLTRIRADLPSDLERIINRCLEKNPRDRAQSALDVNSELRRLHKALERGEVEKPARHKIATIAVLPFVNRSASADDEYFSDGLADELLNVLARIQGLRVSARTSSFTFKGRQATVGEIGSALNVASVLEGSVRKAGNRIRVSVQLVQVSDGYHLWSETYDRMLDDIFAVQDDIAQSVVKELRTALLGEVSDSGASGHARAEVANAAKGRGTNPEAHRLFLLARYLLDRGAREDTARAVEYLRQAVGLDPEFATAWAELARACAREADMGWGPMKEAYQRALEAAERALALEPNLAEAHAHIAWIRTYDWDWRGAEASTNRALELAPGSPQVLRVAGVVAKILGRFEESIAINRRAIEQDPLNPSSYANLAIVLAAADRLSESDEAFRRSLELSPQRAALRAGLALNLLAQGRTEEAIAMARQEPVEWSRLQALAIIYHESGREAESGNALRELAETLAEDGAFQIAEAQATVGEADAAFEWLERAYAQRDAGLTQLRSSPLLRPLHADPRWGVFLKKMGLGE